MHLHFWGWVLVWALGLVPGAALLGLLNGLTDDDIIDGDDLGRAVILTAIWPVMFALAALFLVFGLVYEAGRKLGTWWADR